ncbi:MAG: hypothetical protein QXP80_05700 [Zestosphaera sp.]
MNRRLLVLSVNVLAVSALVLLYGVVTYETSLIGVALSSILLGLVLLTSCFTVTESIVNALTEYSTLTSNALASVTEDMDLLESKMYVVQSGEGLRLVIIKVGRPEGVGPGLGVRFGEPYLAIPIDDVLKDVPQVEELVEGALESSLTSVLVETLGLCSRVVVRWSGGYVRVELVGVSKALEGLKGLPLNPFNTLVAVALARITGRGVKLVESGSTVGGMYFTHEVF